VSAVLVASTDTERHVVILTVEGASLDEGHVDTMASALAVLPSGFGLVIDLTGVGELGFPVITELRDLAREAKFNGRTLVFVCGELARRTELVLADLDTLAPVVDALEHAVPLVRTAA
jgi:hypothetical protein